MLAGISIPPFAVPTQLSADDWIVTFQPAPDPDQAEPQCNADEATDQAGSRQRGCADGETAGDRDGQGG